MGRKNIDKLLRKSRRYNLDPETKGLSSELFRYLLSLEQRVTNLEQRKKKAGNEKKQATIKRIL